MIIFILLATSVLFIVITFYLGQLLSDRQVQIPPGIIPSRIGFIAPLGIPWGLSVFCPIRMYKDASYIISLTADTYIIKDIGRTEKEGDRFVSFLVKSRFYNVDETQEDVPRILDDCPKLTIELLAPGFELTGRQKQSHPLRLRYSPGNESNNYPEVSQQPNGFVPEKAMFTWGLEPKDGGKKQISFVITPDPPEAFDGLVADRYGLEITVFELDHLSRRQVVLIKALSGVLASMLASATFIYTLGKIFWGWK